jgi:hypothetical protein
MIMANDPFPVHVVLHCGMFVLTIMCVLARAPFIILLDLVLQRFMQPLLRTSICSHFLHTEMLRSAPFTRLQSSPRVPPALVAGSHSLRCRRN